MIAGQRKNLLKLAAYLESLPEDYEHFDMAKYVDHYGDCVLPMPISEFAARKPHDFLENCGTVACAVGHGPAAGIAMSKKEIRDWDAYAERAFGCCIFGPNRSAFEFMFGADWDIYDNHHYGAAARIRQFLDTGKTDYAGPTAAKSYTTYRKGSRSAKRREIDAVAA